MRRLKALKSIIVALFLNKEYIVVVSAKKKLSNSSDEILVFHNIESKKYWYYCSAMEQAALRNIDGIYDLVSKVEDKERWN